MNKIVSMAKFLRNFALCALIAAPFAVSCDKYDDTEIKAQLEDLVNKVFELEQKMNSEIDALKSFLDGNILIKSVTTDEEDGMTVIELSNGTKFRLLPEKLLKSFVTYITSGGVDYWAYIDEDGKKQYFYNDEGEAIPVVSEMPKVVTKDGDTFLVIGGVSHPISGNSVFSDYELIKDDSGNVLAVTFTFGEDMTFTVTVDGSAGLLFVQASGSTSKVLTEYFVANGETTKVQIQANGVVDYVLQIPYGWRVKEVENTQGTKYLEITAPATSVVEGGLAVADGELKVVSVLEGGKASASKLYLTTDPFKEFVISSGKATVKRNSGFVKYVYGICDEESYDEEQIFATADQLIKDATSVSEGYNVMLSDIEEMSLAKLTKAELIAGSEYVLWAVPAFYSGKRAEFYTVAGTVRRTVGIYGSVDVEVKNPAFRDAQMNLAIEGASAYYFNLVLKESYDAAHIVNVLNTAPETYTAKTGTEAMTYSGSIFEFAGVQAVENTGYVAWVVIANNGREYLESDVIACEFATLPYVAGSAVSVTVGEETRTSADVAVNLTATGAERIYYMYFKSNAIPTFASDEAEAKYLMENGQMVAGETAEARASNCFEGALDPETSVTLLALATDATGKYSKVTEKEYMTTPAGANGLKVNLSVSLNTPAEVKVDVSVQGGQAEDYIYWIGKATAGVWTNSAILGGNAKTARAYMIANPTESRFTTTKDKYPVVNGTVSMADLEYLDKNERPVKYIMVVIAKDAEGLYSEATILEFLPHSFDIGNIVPGTSDGWKAAEKGLAVEFIEETFYTDGEFSGYSYTVSIPENYTAYILSGTDSWFTDDEGRAFTVEEKILDILQSTDKRRDAWGTSTDDGPVDLGWRYEHGNPKMGAAVVWANEAFHKDRCKCQNGLCEHEHVHCDGNRTVNMTWMGTENVPVDHVVLFNEGEPVGLSYTNAAGNTGKVVDRVFVVLQDLDGNCYEPYAFDVPYEYWTEGGGGFGVNPEE